MKIYINNFNINILDKIIKKLNEYLIRCETYIQIYSTDGIYQVSEKSTNKLVISDDNVKIYRKYYDNFTLITDNSYYEEEICNQIHPENISTNMKRSIFKLNKNSNLQLVFEGIFSNDDTTNIKHNDIYFELPKNIDINDALVKKEIIVFLSLLNNIVI
jgi:hypothetical protein